jgi:L-alanine-DL-glutamate epimerase-like enolase superfamily enzyme
VQLEFHSVTWAFASPFTTAYRSKLNAETIQVTLTDGVVTGRGESSCVAYRGETIDLVLDQLSSIENEILNGISRVALQNRMPAGGARNAIDCALWDIEAKRCGRRAWSLAGLHSISPLITAYTLSLDSPENMAQAAARAGRKSVLKLKLGGDNDAARVAAVRRARPDAMIIVDANQSWSVAHLDETVPLLAALDVKLIEQPLPVTHDEALRQYRGAIPICADESCQTTASLSELVGKYQCINIKLDKTGGLTEALEVAKIARQLKFDLMVGCMGGSSLAMAPAFVLGQFCSIIDLDGPLLATSDMPNAIRYDGCRMFPPEASLWG